MYSAAVAFTIPVIFSFLVSYKKSDLEKIPNPVLFPFWVYVVTILPSYTNTQNLPAALLFGFNFVAMVFMFFIVGNHVTTYKQIRLFVIVYLAMSIANGMSLIKEGIQTKKRVFGFSGIVFVDMVNVAIIILAIIILVKKGSQKLPYTFLAIFLFIALLFTQTRNAILSLFLTFLFLLGYLFYYNKTFVINRMKILRTFIVIFISFVMLIISFAVVLPENFKRFQNFFSSNEKESVSSTEDIYLNNSGSTRFLIWHTALQAIVKHPIIGIGAYSFPTESRYYFKIPIMLYKKFVKGLSSHITYLSVITETGLFGLAGFLFFIITGIKMGLTAIRLSRDKSQRYFSLGILVIQVYITISMAMSDAWLWGRCGMLWAIVLGLSIANYRIVMRSQSGLKQ